MFVRYAIQSKPTEDCSSVDENEYDIPSQDIVGDEEKQDVAVESSYPTATLRDPRAVEPPRSITHNDEDKEESQATNYSNNKNLFRFLQCACSTILLVFCVVVVMSAVFTEQTTVSESSHALVAFLVLWFLIIWLAMMEGGQGCLVGLQPVDKDLYANSHPVSYKCAALAQKRDNMNRFIVGRQFLVVLVVFGINLCGSAIADANVLGLPDPMREVFLASGVALMLMTIILGQLAAQVNATNCMLDFINNYGMLATTYISLAIEASGLLHCVYLVRRLILLGTGTGNGEVGTDAATVWSRLFFWVRVVFSLAGLGFAFAVTLWALFHRQTALWEGVPDYVAVLMLLVLLGLVGLLEGLQIA